MLECTDDPIIGLTPQQTSELVGNLSTGWFQIGVSFCRAVTANTGKYLAQHRDQQHMQRTPYPRVS